MRDRGGKARRGPICCNSDVPCEQKSLYAYAFMHVRGMHMHFFVRTPSSEGKEGEAWKRYGISSNAFCR